MITSPIREWSSPKERTASQELKYERVYFSLFVRTIDRMPLPDPASLFLARGGANFPFPFPIMAGRGVVVCFFSLSFPFLPFSLFAIFISSPPHTLSSYARAGLKTRWRGGGGKAKREDANFFLLLLPGHNSREGEIR